MKNEQRIFDLNLEKINPIQSDSKLKTYYFPHYHKFLMKGDVRRLKMAFSHYQGLVDAEGVNLVYIKVKVGTNNTGGSK